MRAPLCGAWSCLQPVVGQGSLVTCRTGAGELIFTLGMPSCWVNEAGAASPAFAQPQAIAAACSRTRFAS